MQPSIAPHPPYGSFAFAHEDASSPAVLTVRLSAGVDVDRLADEISCAWRTAGGSRRESVGLALSVVETCGRSAAERERDALRLLRDERRAAGPRGTLRATLVRLAPQDHLLMLSAVPGSTALGALGAIAEELERFYPIARVALG